MPTLTTAVIFIGLINPGVAPEEKPVKDNVWVGEEFKCEDYYVRVKLYWLEDLYIWDFLLDGKGRRIPCVDI